MNKPLYFQSAAELSAALAAGKTTSVEIMKALLARTAEVEPRIHAFNSYDAADALAQAEAADARRAAGQSLGPLDGIPVAMKDVISVRGQPLTCSSRMLGKFVSPYDATVTERLRKAGAIIWGRLNLDEFAMGSSTENSATQTTRNPWDTTRVPGGSSGGCSAAVAAGEAIISLGSDTGGSIRQPAALCGIVGMKPTYGLVSRYGLVAFASSLDQIGPFSRTVEDSALLLQAIAGHDERDSTSVRAPVPDYSAAIRERKGPWKLGIPSEYFGEGIHPDVASAVRNAIAYYESIGCTIMDISLPHTEYAVPVYYILATAEASSNLARYDGVRYSHRSPDAKDAIDIYHLSRAEGFGPEVKRRIILGTYVLSSGYYDAYYLRAQKVRTLIRNDFLKAFENVDAILTPTSPIPAFKVGEKADDPLAMYLSDICTISCNLAGICGLSLPCGFTSEGLPVGLQILGKPFGEADLFAIAHAYEQAHDWNQRHPKL
jgi:aspartyl-tRNA(Asn)/glutamyl-tRNA(Gln) amidotransferase subunit A